MALFILLLSMEQGYFETLRQGVTLFEMLVAFFLHNKHLE
jgi:hypothetical protein